MLERLEVLLLLLLLYFIGMHVVSCYIAIQRSYTNLLVWYSVDVEISIKRFKKLTFRASLVDVAPLRNVKSVLGSRVSAVGRDDRTAPHACRRSVVVSHIDCTRPIGAVTFSPGGSDDVMVRRRQTHVLFRPDIAAGQR